MAGPNKGSVLCHPYVGPVRLDGELAAGDSLVASTTYKRRIDVLGANTIKIRAKVSSLVGAVNLDVHPLLADATDVDASGTRATTDVPAAVALVDATEIQMDITVDGERYYDVEIAPGVGESMDIDHIDVFAKF